MKSKEAGTRIKIPEKHFCGFIINRRDGEDFYLGFMCPHDNTEASKKREETVRHWRGDGLRGWWGDDKKPTLPVRDFETFDNKFMSGFKLAQMVGRYGSWNGNNKVWRVVDPRGFELEISSDNLAQIINEVGIEKGGDLPGEFIWGRDGAVNVLVPRGSGIHVAAVENKKVFETKNLSQKDLIEGRTYKTRSGEEFIFVGCLWVVYRTGRLQSHKSYIVAGMDNETLDIGLDIKKKYLYIRRDVYDNGRVWEQLMVQTSPKKFVSLSDDETQYEYSLSQLRDCSYSYLVKNCVAMFKNKPKDAKLVWGAGIEPFQLVFSVSPPGTLPKTRIVKENKHPTDDTRLGPLISMQFKGSDTFTHTGVWGMSAEIDGKWYPVPELDGYWFSP